MSSANVELVRSIYATWERGDFRSADWADPGIEYVIPEGPGFSTWKGIAGLVEGFRIFVSAWDEYRVVADDYRELDAERVLVLVHYLGRGKASGLELGQMRAKGAHLFHLHDGKVTKFVAYINRERALADLGLPSEAGSEHA
jgi:ketosteroid isomerase-like protein